MARPTDKLSLLDAARSQYEKLLALLEGLDSETQRAEFAFADRDRNCRDVLIHLVEWQRLLLDFVQKNEAGVSQPFLPAPYKWNNYSEMNAEFQRRNQSVGFAEAERLLAQTHEEVLNLIEGRSDEELFVKKYYPWTGTTSLGSYCVSATSSHYEWAMKKIRKHKKLAATGS